MYRTFVATRAGYVFGQSRRERPQIYRGYHTLVPKAHGTVPGLFGTQLNNRLTTFCYSTFIHSGKFMGTVGNITALMNMLCVHKCSATKDANLLINNFYKHNRQLIELDTNQILFRSTSCVDSFALSVALFRKTLWLVHWLIGLGYFIVLPLLAIMWKRFPLWILYTYFPAYVALMTQWNVLGHCFVLDVEKYHEPFDERTNYTFPKYAHRIITWSPLIYTTLLTMVIWKRRCESC